MSDYEFDEMSEPVNKYVSELLAEVDVRTILSALTATKLLRAIFGERYGDYVGMSDTELKKEFSVYASQRLTKGGVMTIDDLKRSFVAVNETRAGGEMQAEFLDAALFKGGFFDREVSQDYIDSVSIEDIKRKCGEGQSRGFPNFMVFKEELRDVGKRAAYLDYVQRMADEISAKCMSGTIKVESGKEVPLLFGDEFEDLSGYEVVDNFQDVKLAMAMGVMKIRTQGAGIAVSVFGIGRKARESNGKEWYVTDGGIKLDENAERRLVKAGLVIPTYIKEVYEVLGTGPGCSFYLHRSVVKKTIQWLRASGKVIGAAAGKNAAAPAVSPKIEESTESDVADGGEVVGDYDRTFCRIISHRNLSYPKICAETYGASAEEIETAVRVFEKDVVRNDKPGKLARNALVGRVSTPYEFRKEFIKIGDYCQHTTRMRDLGALLGADRIKSGIRIVSSDPLTVKYSSE